MTSTSMLARLQATTARPLMRLRRLVADFPGMLRVVEYLARHRTTVVRTPDGDSLVVNSFLHAQVAKPELIAEYEADVRMVLQRLVTPGMTVYDIGANVGIFTLLAARLTTPSGQVYAFEPEPNNLRCLTDTVQRNGLRHVRVDERAVGDTTGTQIFDRRGGAFSGRLVAGNTAYHRSPNTVSMPTVRLDDLVERDGFRPPDVLKIDVEGAEAAVLAGATRTLESYRPAILCELHTHLGDSMDGVIDRLRAHGYRILTPDGEPWTGPMTFRDQILALPNPGASTPRESHEPSPS